LERRDDHHAGIVGIAAEPEHMVDLLLPERKSEERLLHALRFFDMGDLILLCREQAELDRVALG